MDEGNHLIAAAKEQLQYRGSAEYYRDRLQGASRPTRELTGTLDQMVEFAQWCRDARLICSVGVGYIETDSVYVTLL